MIYHVAYWGLFFSSFIEMNFRNKNVKKIIYVSWVLALFLLSAFRYKTGYDWFTYERYFDEIKVLQSSSKHLFGAIDVEPAFILISGICSRYSQLIFCFASLGILVKAKYYCRDNNKIFCLFMYYCSIFIFYDIGVIRQGVAIAICYYSLKYIKRKQFIQFISIIFVAACFHVTALMVIPLYFLGDKHYNRRFYYVVVALSLLIMNKYVYYTFLFICEKFGFGYVSTRLQYYIFTYRDNGNVLNSLIKRIIFLIFFIEFFERKKNKKVWIYINAYFASVVMSIVLSSQPILMGRGTAILYYMQIFIFSNILSGCKQFFAKLIVFVGVAILYYYSLIGVIYTQKESFFPYQNWLFK